MSVTIKIKRGTDLQRQVYTPAEGELVYTTDTKKVYIGDGVTAGGIPVNKIDMLTTEVRNTKVIPEGVLVFDVTEGNLYIGDGTTSGGVLASESTVDWSEIVNKPTSTVTDIDTQVSKAHDQNTDTELFIDEETVLTALEIKDFIDSKGQANGLATLDVNGKVPTTELPDTILGQLSYIGTYDQSTGVYPSNPSKGDYYVVNKAGIIDTVDYEIGDWMVYNGTSWDKIDNSDKVSSIAGKTGVVTLVSTDITDFDEAVSEHTDVAANTTARHTHTNKTVLDAFTDTTHLAYDGTNVLLEGDVIDGGVLS